MNKSLHIMETSFIIPIILQLLSARYGISCSVEELTELVLNTARSSKPFGNHPVPEKEIQAILLETLLLLNEQGLVFLDPDTDRSVITVKGLLKTHNRILCN